jgi:16S rRNA (guanine(527)-N(7))-methyltransferase RsmG
MAGPPVKSSKDVFLSTCSKNKFILTDLQIQLLEKYTALLLIHNKNLNLVSRKDEENVWTNHILHCTSLLFHRRLPAAGNVLDLFTCGGLPGMVYAILNPYLRFTLLDATRKKIAAVQMMVRDLGLLNVQTVWGRAEDIGRLPHHVGRYDIVLARAVAPLDKLIDWSMPFLREKHKKYKNPAPDTISVPSLVAFKGGNIDREIRRAERHEHIKKIDLVILNPEEEKKAVIVGFG